MLPFIILLSLSNVSSFASSIVAGSTQTISAFMAQYGYWAVAGLMALESATLPVPSEIVMPIAGLLSSQGIMYFPYAFLASMLGTAVGISVDYYIAYFIEKDIVYKYLRKMHIKERRLDEFTAWFERNGSPVVFLTRLLPVVRTVISFPAGFAKMDQKRFFLYSLSGSAIWNIVLMFFGYYALNTSSAVDILIYSGIFAIVLYAIYVFAMRRIRKR